MAERRSLWALGLAVLVIGLWSAISTAAKAEQITVFAAASLKTALDRIAADFTSTTGHEVVISYAGTSMLARQVSLGAPADVVISASSDWMEWLAERGAVDGASQIEIAGNRLVLIAHGRDVDPIPADRAALAARLADARIAMALVDAVPAGIYGKAALVHFDLWTQVAPQVAQTDNVRAALALVATGAAPFGVVYLTDATADPRVTVLTTFPPESHPKITYPAALVTGGATPAARSFLSHMTSASARAQLVDHGFVMPRARP
ncbi:molybdate ABC transporter substrate-binding protein [uncultured Roseobacter sp.]|uniref:molybdate ABC transporter substrate-binding protein n=1 Tax=uncultured Roseobacter sp. TaxID=114847 RepID=UPI0026161C60|nr:molybdate ABC transporter substrate-binding protein [uncultured Roseobacter sp.]